MNQDQLALLADNSVSDGGRIIGLWVSEHGQDEDGVELPFETIQKILHDYPGKDSIRRHLRMLEGAGWVERVPGGRGHSDRFIWIGSDQDPPYEEDRVGPEPHSKDRVGPTPTLSEDRVGPTPTLSSRSSSRREVVVGEGDEGPPSVSPPAEKAIEENADLLEGCRTILRGYLSHRVPADRQVWFVQTLVGWLEGIDTSAWKLSDGSSLPEEERTGALRSAMSELLSGDETIMKRPVGDPANLKTKMSIILRQRGTNGTGDSGSRRKSARGIGSNQPEHVVE